MNLLITRLKIARLIIPGLSITRLKNTTLEIAASMLLILTLIACEASHNPPASATKFTTLTPPVLRSIDISNLSARVTIGNITNTYFAADFPDDRWLIEFDFQPNQTYDIAIEWFADNYLVLEETGQFYTNPDELTIKPELDFISAGYDRFDEDCDGSSNIEELIHGSDLNAGPEQAESACTDVADDSDLKEEQTAWIIKQLQPLESDDFMERVTTYEQAMLVSIINPDQSAAYGVTLRTRATDNEKSVTTRIDLINHLENGRQLRFRVDSAPDPDTFIAANPSCRKYLEGYTCIIDYEWDEQIWYSVKLEQISETNWQGSVHPVATGIQQTIATIETDPNISWHRPQINVSTINTVTAAQCKLGLQPLGVRYARGVANSTYTVGSIHTVHSPCIRAGAGWSEGVRTIDDQRVHYLTLGRTE